MEEKPVHWKEIRKLFGSLVEADLKEGRIEIEKTLTGGLVVAKKHGYILDECRYLYKKKVAKKIATVDSNNDSDIYKQRMMKCKPEAYDLDGEDNFDLFVNFKRTLDLSTENVVPKPSKKSMPQEPDAPNKFAPILKIAMLEKDAHTEFMKVPQYVDSCSYEQFDELHVFSKDSSTADKFREFIGPKLSGYESCLPLVEPIFGKFLKAHTRCGYKYILRSIPQDKSLLPGQLSCQQLLEYFRRIFLIVVPIELFGCRRNMKKIRRMIRKYFRTAFGEYFSAKAVTNSLNINTVEWLRVIENENSKMLIMSHLVESFFEKYVMAILGTYIYTEKLVSNYEKIFCRLEYWICYSKQYIERQKRNEVYKEIEKKESRQLSLNNVPEAKLNLHLKQNGIRPILLTCPNATQRREARILNRLLYQLFLKKFEIVKLQKLESLWRNVHETRVGREDASLYFVTCDIYDAFGSIIQQKLLDIVLSMIDELDNKLIVRKFSIFNPRYSLVKYLYREYFDCPSLPLALPAKTLGCRQAGKNGTTVEKEWVKNRITSYILHRKVKINNKEYNQKKGIGQGIPLTSLLCEIYYGNMVLEELGSFMNSGHLLRYVDDFLYFTEDRASAERFLERVHGGIENYNCNFNAKKTSSNLPPYCADEFVYLGYCFNVKTLNVTPCFSDVPIRYSSNLRRPHNSKAIIIFKRRLQNYQFFKIYKFVLDPSINSKNSIEKTIDEIGKLSAKRCFAYLISIFDLKDVSGPFIFDIIIKYAINPLCSKIAGLYFGKEMTKQDFRFVKNKIWQAYFHIFRRNIELFKKLGPRLKAQLKRMDKVNL